MNLCTVLLAAVLLCWQMSAMKSDEAAISDAVNQFSKALYQELSSGTENLVVSPFSVNAVVSMLLMGMRGDTERNVSRALFLPESRSLVAQGFKSIFTSLQTSQDVILELANKIYIAEGFHIKDEFRNDTREYFNSEVEEVDIARKTEEVRTAVNRWAEDKTHDKIKDLLAPGSLSPAAVMILLNAIYFKGLWATPFVKGETRDSTFHLISGSEKTVPMMYLTKELFYTELSNINAQVLKLPYKGNAYSMVILLPRARDGIRTLEANMNSLDISQILKNMESVKVTVNLPRFKILKETDLIEPLKKLGMSEIFSPGGDFSGVTNQGIYISKALQKAYIEVNEEGTEAAAVTVVQVAAFSAIVGQRKKNFIADRPFMYMIIEESLGTTLFIGRVMEPQE